MDTVESSNQYVSGMTVKNSHRVSLYNDKGHYYVILREEGDFVYVADGILKLCEQPKKKNCRHIEQNTTYLKILLICVKKHE